MDGITLAKYIKTDSDVGSQFRGIFAADHLLNCIPKFPGAIIANSATSDHPGIHWVSFYCTMDHTIEFFDSYGHDAGYYHPEWTDWTKKYTNVVIYNRKPVQSPYSAACGLHCLYYLHHRCLGHLFADIMETYSTNLIRNDKMVEIDMEQHYKTDIVIDDYGLLYNQICHALK